MTDNLINQITLECLTNKDCFYHNKINKTNTINKNDKKFYRKRILALTKSLLLDDCEYKEKLLPDVNHSFNNYIKTCINNFKILDKHDIIQEDYIGLELLDKNNNENIEEVKSKEEADKLMMRSIPVFIPNLRNFVKITNFKKPVENIITNKKNINLKDPALKIKGINNSLRKKKNIINMYDNTKNNENKET